MNNFIEKLDSILFEATWIRAIGGVSPGDPTYPDLPTEEADDPGTWYHGTCTIFIKDIMRDGLKAPHLTIDRKLSLFSARRVVDRFGGEPVVLEVNTDGLDIEITGTKLDSKTDGAIPPDRLRKLRVRK